MVQFIADHRAVFGVEPICAVLPIAPSTYHRHRHQRTHPTRRSARAQRDDQLRVEIQRVYDAHQQVYGPRKVWKQLRRDGVRVARCTVARLMRAMGLAGAVRGRAWVTTTHAGEGGRPVDLVDRRFVATRPNQLWVSDFTYVATWGGFVYVAFVIDVFARRIVGWRVSASMRTDFVLDALEQAIYARRGDALTGLVRTRFGRSSADRRFREARRSAGRMLQIMRRWGLETLGDLAALNSTGRRNTSMMRCCDADACLARKRRRSDRAGRPAMRSPGRPPATGRDRSSNGSGRRSRGGCRVRMPLCPVACRRPWVVVGSVRAVVCRRGARQLGAPIGSLPVLCGAGGWRRRRGRVAWCGLPLAAAGRDRNLCRSCELRAPGCVTLPVGSGEPRRLSRESCVATRRLVLQAAVWRIGRRLRSGTAPDVPSARRSPSWPRTIG